METINLIGIISIAMVQLLYILIQHFFYTREIKELKTTYESEIEELKKILLSFEIQLKDKSSVINELQNYSTALTAIKDIPGNGELNN